MCPDIFVSNMVIFRKGLCDLNYIVRYHWRRIKEIIKVPRLKGIGVPITDLRRSDDRLMWFITVIPIPMRWCLVTEQRPWRIQESSTCHETQQSTTKVYIMCNSWDIPLLLLVFGKLLNSYLFDYGGEGLETICVRFTFLTTIYPP